MTIGCLERAPHMFGARSARGAHKLIPIPRWELAAEWATVRLIPAPANRRGARAGSDPRPPRPFMVPEGKTPARAMGDPAGLFDLLRLLLPTLAGCRSARACSHPSPSCAGTANLCG